jgi:hypothetical protein
MAGREEIGNNQPQALNSLLVKMDKQKALGVAAPGAFALPVMELIFVRLQYTTFGGEMQAFCFAPGKDYSI